ncbi:MAG: MFS transporter [Sporolactobacillus sp.]
MTTESDKYGYNRFLFIFVLLAGTFTMSISQSSLSTAYPVLMNYFGIPASTVQWLTTGFMLVMCILMPISPWLLHNVKFNVLFLGTVALFDIGTLIIILAPNFPLMMTGRILEAAAVGILFPSFQTVLLTITEDNQRGTTMGIAGLVMGSALAYGPIVSGIVLHSLSWRSLFIVFLIVITCVLVLAFFFIKNVMPYHPSHIDILSVIYSIGIIGILYIINGIGKTGTHWVANFSILAISLIALVLFVIRQLRLDTPLLQLRVFKIFHFDCAVILTASSYIALIVTTIIFPLYYQGILGLSPFASGMSLVPAALLLSLLNPLTGKLADSIGYKRTMEIGMSLIVIGWLALTLIAGEMNLPLMIFLSMIIEGGNAFVMMPAVTLGANSLPPQLTADSTAVITTMRQIFGSTGVAVATLILTNVTAHQIRIGQSEANASIQSYHAIFLTFLIVEAAALLFSFFMEKDIPGSAKN